VWRDDGAYRLVAPNLTPDAESGIGRWTDEQLSRAIREGIGHDGRALHPAMWSSSFRHLSDDDVAAVVAYLRTLPAIRNPLPLTALAPEEQGRIDEASRLAPKPVDLAQLGDPVERGRHMVLLADCAGCHTSWTSRRMPGMLAGGNLIERGDRTAFSSNLTPHPSGVPYDAESFVQVMRTGKAGGMSPLMPWVVFRNLSDADLRAIHAYLQSLDPVAHYINNMVAPSRCVVCGQEHSLGAMNTLARPTGIALDSRVYEEYVGSYRSDDYGVMMTVTRKEGRLFARWEEEKDGELIPQSETRFIMIGGIAPLRFARDSAGRVTHLISEEVEELAMRRVASALAEPL
jgi:mono/diheme cytochrome c family protein